jgi:predicted Zn-dependent protease
MNRFCGFQLAPASRQKGNPANNYDQIWRRFAVAGYPRSRPANWAWLFFLGIALSQCGTLSIEEEQQLGERQVAELESELRLVTNPRVAAYVDQLGARLLATAPDRSYQYRFRVVRSDALNAFALAGGNIYVTSGALLAARNVAELASIMAHEIAHVQAGHIREHYYRFRNSRATSELTAITLALITGNPFLAGAGDLAANLGTSAYIASHTREAEREADVRAFSIMVAAGFDPRSQLTLLARLQAASIGTQGQMPFLLTHPLPAERVENARARLADAGETRQLQVNGDGSLEEIQRLLAAQ